MLGGEQKSVVYESSMYSNEHRNIDIKGYSWLPIGKLVVRLFVAQFPKDKLNIKLTKVKLGCNCES